jgi:hypothetical protein
MKIKIFEIRWTSQNEKEWIAAYSLIGALKEYCSTTGTDLVDMEDDDEIIELPESEWDKHTVRLEEEGDNTITFREFLEKELDNKPGMVAGTMYD